MAHVVYTMENARRMRDAFLSGRARSTDSPPASASVSAPTSGSGAAGGTGEGNGSQANSEHPSSMRDGAPFVILIFDCTGMEKWIYSFVFAYEITVELISVHIEGEFCKIRIMLHLFRDIKFNSKHTLHSKLMLVF